jgi:hypothetical protein
MSNAAQAGRSTTAVRHRRGPTAHPSNGISRTAHVSRPPPFLHTLSLPKGQNGKASLPPHQTKTPKPRRPREHRSAGSSNSPPGPVIRARSRGSARRNWGRDFRRRAASPRKLPERSKASCSGSRALGVARSSPGFRGEPARRVSGACVGSRNGGGAPPPRRGGALRRVLLRRFLHRPPGW